ncbi:MAG TPA: hypothetical protein QGH10_19550 [Armatimonadota bacterium]|nr:hypothetical protein [Armatimonadota bacterium]
MGALGHYLESEGLATVGISLVREHTAAQQPPRFLWVPFPLGRPLGAPSDAKFQHRVIAATLGLLDEPDGPVLADFPDDAPGQDEATNEWACPVSFPSPENADEDWTDALRVEMRALEPWYELGRTRRGGTAVGTSGIPITEALQRLLDAVEHSGPGPDEPAPTWTRNLKLAVEDLRAYYLEAVTSQPGEHPPTAVNDWFWGETQAGALLVRLARTLSGDADPRVRGLARGALVPRSHMPA